MSARLEPDGSKESSTLTVASTFDTAGNAVQLDCRDWVEMVWMEDPRLTAIRLGNLTNIKVSSVWGLTEFRRQLRRGPEVQDHDRR